MDTSQVDMDKLVNDLAQQEYAESLLDEFQNLIQQLPGVQPAKLLFNIDESDTFHVEQIVEEIEPPNIVPPDLDTAFTTAGFPLPQNRSVASVGDSAWQITVQEPAQYTGKGATFSDRIVTFGSLNPANLTDGPQVDTQLEIVSGPGQGLTAGIVQYLASLNMAVLDWQIAPGTNSTGQVSVIGTPVDVSGITVAVSSGKPTVSISAAEGGAPGNSAWKGWNLTIIDGPGEGLTGTITDQTGMALTMAADWPIAPTPTASKAEVDGVTGTFAVVTFTPATGQAPDKIDLTVDPAPGANAWEGKKLRITDGPGKGLTWLITTNSTDASTTTTQHLTLDATSTPGSESKGRVSPPAAVNVSGIAVSGTSVTVATATGDAPTANAWNDRVLTITDGPGLGLTGTITATAAASGSTPITLTMNTGWKAVPDKTSTFAILKQIRYTIKEVEDIHGSRLDVYGDTVDPALKIQYRIAQIDQQLSKQLATIMHQDPFQALESSWRSLHNLVFNTETGVNLKLRLLNVTRAELQADLDNAVEFDQSVLFKKVYEEEYGMFGGSPYSCLLADIEFGRSAQDVSLLEDLSGVAAAAHAPLITNASPLLFDMKSFVDLDKPRDLEMLFDSAELIKWRAFRDTEDSRYVALALPHVLLRQPYGPETVPVDDFNFDETADADKPADFSNFLWGKAAWVLGERITNAFSLYGWTAAIRGYEGGGLVSNLPIFTYKTDDGDIAVQVPTEVAITDRREFELSNLGFIALCYRKGTDEATFFGGQTTNKPKIYVQDAATANAHLSSSLPYMMAASRFAHYIKVMMRDKIGSFMTRDNVAAFLNGWISQYVLLNDNAAQETKARYPLREGRVDVTDDPARPGYYNAVVFLRPHFQLEELTVSIRLVATLPPPVGQ